MRKFRNYCLVALLVIPRLPLAQAADSNESALTVYKSGDYQTAIPLLQAAGARDPKNAAVQAALLSSFVHQGRVDDASDAADADADNFPNSAEVLTARGEFAFYMGDMPEAEKLFNAAIALKSDTARAHYGMYRLYIAASLYRTGRLSCLRAHQLDPDDALITRAWIGYLTPEKRKETFEDFAKAHPWFYKHLDRNRASGAEISSEMHGRKVFELDGERQEVTLPLFLLMYNPSHVRGAGIELRLNGGHPLRMLLDTGASGILLKQSAIDKAGLSHLGSGETWGIGDGGARETFAAIADTCQLETLRYKTCIVQAVEGKRPIAGDEDGLLGADFFSSYLIEMNFQKRLLHLTPLPAREPNPQGYDRALGPDRAGFTPVFRVGTHLFASTKVNDKSTGLFLIDTGDSISNIDSTFARLSTKIHGNSWARMNGISGQVKDVFEVDKAVIEFARFRQTNLGLIAFNLNNAPEHQEIRMAGILGLPVLSMFQLTLDYRNGLVKFDYLNH